MTSRTRLERKQVDDVLGGEEMWKHADSTAGKALELIYPPVVHHDSYSYITSTLLIIYAYIPSVQSLVRSVNMAGPISISSKLDPLTSP